MSCVWISGPLAMWQQWCQTFNARVTQKWADCQRILWTFYTSYHPQASGIIEHWNSLSKTDSERFLTLSPFPSFCPNTLPRKFGHWMWVSPERDYFFSFASRVIISMKQIRDYIELFYKFGIKFWRPFLYFLCKSQPLTCLPP